MISRSLLLLILLWPLPALAQTLPSVENAPCVVVAEPYSPRESERRVFDVIQGESISLHWLNYAIAGSNDAKVQFSFKFRLLRDYPLYFALTNLALWDIYENSSPFDDINFNPEFFYRFPTQSEWLISLDAGYSHLSNGKDEALSRSWDRAYLRVNKLLTPGPLHILWITHLYAPLATGDENKDVDHYLGYWDTAFVLRGLFGQKRENLDLEFKVHAGEDSIPFNRGHFLAGLKYKLPTEQFKPYLYAQYFYGYGETLLDYTRRDNQFRAGVAFFY